MFNKIPIGLKFKNELLKPYTDPKLFTRLKNWVCPKAYMYYNKAYMYYFMVFYRLSPKNVKFVIFAALTQIAESDNRKAVLATTMAVDVSKFYLCHQYQNFAVFNEIFRNSNKKKHKPREKKSIFVYNGTNI